MQESEEKRLKYLIENYLTPVEKEIIYASFYDKVAASQIMNVLGLKKSTFFSKKKTIINKLKVFDEFDKYYQVFIDDNNVVDNFNAIEIQFLKYFVLLYDKNTIKNKMNCAHETVSYYRAEIYNRLYKYYPEIVRYLTVLRKKYYKTGVKGMKLAVFDFPIFAIRNKKGNFCSIFSDRLSLWQDKDECIKVMKEEDPLCDKTISELILFEFSTIQEFAWIIKRNELLPIEITMKSGKSLRLEVEDVEEIVKVFGNKNPFKEGNV